MENNAVITIVSNASVSDNEKIEVVSPGIYESIEEGYRITYEETELSGMAGTTTMITVKDNEVILERDGTTTTKMTFNEKETSVSLYNTPYGMLEIMISTEKLSVEAEENKCKIEIKYDMAVAGQKPLNTALFLEVIKK